ncbi:MAG: hypothetical protein AB2375_08420 [Tissierellaceae bacterium]
MKMLILDARPKVIQAKSWTGNGFLKMKNKDGTGTGYFRVYRYDY